MPRLRDEKFKKRILVPMREVRRKVVMWAAALWIALTALVGVGMLASKAYLGYMGCGWTCAAAGAGGTLGTAFFTVAVAAAQEGMAMLAFMAAIPVWGWIWESR